MAGVLGILVAITATVMLATSKVLKVADAQSIFVRTAGGVVAAILFTKDALICTHCPGRPADI